MVECVVNISEGRDLDRIEDISDILSRKGKTLLLHRDIGDAANRTVFTIVGQLEGLFAVLEDLIVYARQYLDIKAHTGQHPRCGIIDVIPFIPFDQSEMESVTSQVRPWTQSIAEAYSLPICYYGGLHPYNRPLSEIRKKARRMSDAEAPGDLVSYGPLRAHDKLGLCCVTVRDFMAAYNIDLSTTDLATAKSLARDLRELRKQQIEFSDVKFMAWHLDNYDTCQISTNIYDLRSVSLKKLFKTVSDTAQRYSIRAVGSELIGMIPRWGITEQEDELDSVIKDIGLSHHGFDPHLLLILASDTRA